MSDPWLQSYLGKRIPELKVVREPPGDPRAIYFGACFTLAAEDGSEKRCRIVGPDETDAVRGDISIDSPMARALLPVLRQRSRATVLNVGSAAGRIGLPGFSVYGGAKAGLRGFSEALRRELADDLHHAALHQGVALAHAVPVDAHLPRLEDGARPGAGEPRGDVDEEAIEALPRLLVRAGEKEGFCGGGSRHAGERGGASRLSPRVCGR